MMSLEQLKNHVSSLSLTTRVTLMRLILASLRYEENHSIDLEKITDQSDRFVLGTKPTAMRGFLNTNQPPPSDEEVKTLLAKRQAEKFLQ